MDIIMRNIDRKGLIGLIVGVVCTLLGACLIENRNGGDGPGPSIAPVVSMDVTVPLVGGGG